MPDWRSSRRLLLSRHGLARGRAGAVSASRCCIITCRIAMRSCSPPTIDAPISCAIILRLTRRLSKMMSHPDNPYVKLLVVFGRDDKTCVASGKRYRAKGIFSSVVSSVVVNDVKPLLALKPYDAPGWCVLSPGHFGELKTCEERLQSRWAGAGTHQCFFESAAGPLFAA